MKAGRHLDSLVAKHVMGWKNLHEEDRYYGSVGSGKYKTLVGDPPEGVQPSIHEDEVPAYSANIAAAWEVVDHILERENGSLQIENTWYGRGWVVTFNDDEWASGFTAPEAICRAALQYFGHEFSESTEEG